MSAFTREYVEELRRESQRKGERIRMLTEALAVKTAECAALRGKRRAAGAKQWFDDQERMVFPPATAD